VIAVSSGVALSAFGPALVEHSLMAVTTPLLLLAGVAMLATAVTATLSASFVSSQPAERAEEPLLARPRLPMVRRDVPFIVVLGAAPKSGATTLACKLAMTVATEGRSPREPARRPRSICLLNSPKTLDGLELDGAGLARYLIAHPTAVQDEVVDLAVRHPSGVEFLSTADGGPNAFQLRQLIPLLRRFYDLVVLDPGKEDLWLNDAAMELADAVIVTSPPSADGQGAIARWPDRVWALGCEGKTVLAVNRRRFGDPAMARQRFQFTWELADDPAMSGAGDSVAGPTSAILPAARRWRAAVRMLVPDLFEGDG
jgi:hypothetical protein